MALDLLIEGARALGLTLSGDQLAAFETYRRELLDWNTRVNLTAITDPAEIERLHFLDSLSCLLALQSDGTASPPSLIGKRAGGSGPDLVDVGTGAGFPGLPLRIVCPDLRLTLVESVGKKSAFLEHVVRRLGLTGVQVVTARAEAVGQAPTRRERFDWAVARAVAPLAVLAEYLLPLARVGGAMLAPKKGDLTRELAEAELALRTLGGAPAEIVPVRLPGLEADRCLVVVRKLAPTPPAYPRRAGLPAKRPIARVTGDR